MSKKNDVIKVKFSNWYDGFSLLDLGPAFNNNKYLSETGLAIKESEEADFIIYNVFGDFIANVASDNSKAIKILFISEPVSSDFIFFDYCIGFEPYDYGGRNCFYPFFLYSCVANNIIPTQVSYADAFSILKSKDIFCEMVFRHDGRDLSRKKYFDLLSSYKKVESAGTYLNNQKDHLVVDYRDGSRTKYDFQKRCKFSLCIQSIKKEWFINEKIMHSLYANEIPIFFGCEEVKTIFNPKRIIFIEDYPNDIDLLNRIIEIDNNDELFCDIISQPIFNNPNFVDETIDNASKFLYDVFVSQKKRLIEKNRESIIKKYIVNNKKSSDELTRLTSTRIYKLFIKVKTIFSRKK